MLVTVTSACSPRSSADRRRLNGHFSGGTPQAFRRFRCGALGRRPPARGGVARMGPRHAHDVVRLGRELEPAPHGGRRPAPSGPASTIGESTVRHPEPARGRRNRLDRQFQAGLVPAPDRPAAPDPQSGVERDSPPFGKALAAARSVSTSRTVNRDRAECS